MICVSDHSACFPEWVCTLQILRSISKRHILSSNHLGRNMSDAWNVDTTKLLEFRSLRLGLEGAEGLILCLCSSEPIYVGVFLGALRRVPWFTG